jgi:uncharacterized protein DUF2255
VTAAWTADELEAIGAAEEPQMVPLAAHGAPRRPVPIWVVRAGGVEREIVLVDAGDDVNDAVDAAYRDKYGGYPSYVGPMVRPEAQATTLRLVPADEQYGAGRSA